MEIKEIKETTEIALAKKIDIVFRFEERNATTIRFVNKVIKITDQDIYYYRDILKKTNCSELNMLVMQQNV